jgi:hypothetical protein
MALPRSFSKMIQVLRLGKNINNRYSRILMSPGTEKRDLNSHDKSSGTSIGILTTTLTVLECLDTPPVTNQENQNQN